MLLKDPLVVYGYDFCRRGIASRIGDYHNEDEKIQDYVDRAVLPAIRRDIKNILSAIYFGASLSELVKEPVGGEVHLAKLYTASADIWWGSAAWEEDEQHNLIAVNTLDGSIPYYDESGIQQLALYTYRPEYNEYFGFPTATQVYPYWYVKSRLLSFYAIYLEKFGSPSIAISTDGNDDGRIQSQYRNIGTDLLMVLPKDAQATILESAHAAGDEFNQAIELLDKYLLLSFTIPKLVVDEGVYSTRAQSTVHLDVYLKSETEMVENLCAWLTQNIIKPMVILNYGQQDDYGTFEIKDPDPVSMETWAAILKDIKDIGLLNLSLESHIEWASEKVGLPVEVLTDGLAGGLDA